MLSPKVDLGSSDYGPTVVPTVGLSCSDSDRCVSRRSTRVPRCTTRRSTLGESTRGGLSPMQQASLDLNSSTYAAYTDGLCVPVSVRVSV
jgi:hypothetical protein